MMTCPHTGITVPECSCRACVQRLLEQHSPASFTGAAAADAQFTGAAGADGGGGELATGLPGVDLTPTALGEASGARGVLRRLRRSRLRRTA